MRCLCRHPASCHRGRWCEACDDGLACPPPPQPLEDAVGEPPPPVPVDGQRWTPDGRKQPPAYRTL